jgi:putative membrane protein
MRAKLLLAAAAASVSIALAACVPNEAAVTAAASGDMTPTTRDAYVGMAAASDLYEIQSSQLARTRARAPAVRDFAQMMIADHTNTTQQLMMAARAAGMPPMTPALLPMQQQMLDQLRAAPAGNFDRVYLDQQVQAHQMALALHSNYAQNGDAPPLRQVAGAAAPIVQQHFDRVRQLASSGG